MDEILGGCIHTDRLRGGQLDQFLRNNRPTLDGSKIMSHFSIDRTNGELKCPLLTPQGKCINGATCFPAHHIEETQNAILKDQYSGYPTVFRSGRSAFGILSQNNYMNIRGEIANAPPNVNKTSVQNIFSDL